jgi:hypothetical protein
VGKKKNGVSVDLRFAKALRELSETIDQVCGNRPGEPPSTGFAVVMFNRESPDDPAMNYLSNVSSAEMVRALRSIAAQLEHRVHEGNQTRN